MASGSSLVVVGAATRDIDAADPRGWRLGGGVTYAAMTAARLGLKVSALIGVDSQAATAAELDVLREAGAQVVLVPLASGPVFDNRQTPAGRVQYAVAASDMMPAAALPNDPVAQKGNAPDQNCSRNHGSSIDAQVEVRELTSFGDR